jgi:hypothetical protein
MNPLLGFEKKKEKRGAEKTKKPKSAAPSQLYVLTFTLTGRLSL